MPPPSLVADALGLLLELSTLLKLPDFKSGSEFFQSSQLPTHTILMCQNRSSVHSIFVWVCGVKGDSIIWSTLVATSSRMGPCQSCRHRP